MSGVPHILRISTEDFEAIRDGTRTFVIRKDDPRVQVGDTLYLTVPEGDHVERRVSCVLFDMAGLTEGYVVLGLAYPVQEAPGLYNEDDIAAACDAVGANSGLVLAMLRGGV
jgi:hypothetical protein